MKIIHLKKDLPAGIVVFLVALPLCLGVALASGAPLLSGIISGIIGGIVVGLLSGSHTSVSGPAAGLTAVVLSSVALLGSFEIFLVSVVIAGCIQVVMGFLKAGIIALYTPSNVIKGLLAAIGIILILKQIPHAIGYDRDNEDDFTFFQPDGETTFSALLKITDFITPGVFLVSIISLFILIGWKRTPLGKFKFLPPSLFVVLIGIGLNEVFRVLAPSLFISPVHRVNIPRLDTGNPGSLIHFPDLNHLANYHVWITGLTVALVASLETLLNLEAIDKLDPHKRESPPNRELVAQGVGNILSGLLGGLPVTSVIVRSSVNMDTGNETKLSTILHGFFILASVLFLVPLMNMIPLGSLAAILLVTGYKLAKISVFREMYAKGWHQFIPFVATLGAIVFTDLLTGILIGSVVSFFYLLLSNYRNPFSASRQLLHVGEVVRLELATQVSFLNKASIKDTLWGIPANGKVIIDARHSDFIDPDVMEVIHDFKNTVAPERQIQLNILGIKDQYKLSDHIQFVNVLDKETQQKLRPAEVLGLLKAGNERFMKGKWNEKYFQYQVNATSMGQNPMAVIISCIDSRTSPEIIFDAGLGDILTIRIAGNVISPEIMGSLEIAVDKLGAKLILVKGHSRCGAVDLSIKNIRDGNIGQITSKIERAIRQCHCNVHELENNSAAIDQITRQNVRNSIEEIIRNSSYLKRRIQDKEIGIAGAFHQIETGEVLFDELL